MVLSCMRLDSRIFQVIRLIPLLLLCVASAQVSAQVGSLVVTPRYGNVQEDINGSEFKFARLQYGGNAMGGRGGRGRGSWTTDWP